MRVEFSPEALAQIDVRRAWWRANRDERDLFDEELDEAVAYIAARNASLPVVMEIGRRKIRRCLLPKTRCHLYSEVEGDRVLIASAWSATMEKPPLL